MNFKNKVLPNIDKRPPMKVLQDINQKSSTVKAGDLRSPSLFFKENQNTDETYNKLNTKLDTHQDKIQDQNNLIQTLTSNFQVLKDQIVKEKNENAKNRETISNQIIEITQLQKQIKQQANNKNDEKLKSTIDQLNKQLDEQKTQNQQLINKNKEQQSQVEKQQSQIEKLQSQIEKLQSQIEKLQSQPQQKVQPQDNKKFQIEIDELKNKDKNNQNKIDELKKQIEKFIESDLINQQQLKDNKMFTESLKKDKNLLLEEKILKNQENNQANNKEIEKEIEKLKQQNQDFQQQIKIFQNNSKNNEQKIKDLNDKIKSNEVEIQEYKKKENEYLTKEQEFNIKIQQLQNENKEKIEQMHKNTIELLEKCKVENEKKFNNQQQKISELENELSHYKNNNKDDQKKIEKQIKQLIDADKEISKQVQCTYCNKPLDQPVTIIPCGHNFCLKCKIGYDKGNCVRCGPKAKIDSIYRNELMDDILNLLKLVRNSRTLLENQVLTKSKNIK